MSRAELELEARTLERGESIRMTCPFCGGGPRGDRRSMSLTHKEDGTLLYHCYRANCGAAGALGRGTLHSTPVRKTSSRVKPSVEHRLRRPEGGSTVWGMWACDLEALGVMWDDETHRLALPIYGPDFRLRGRVLRTMPGDTREPKALTMLYEDGPALAWNRVQWKEAVVVVEDIPSAMKLEFLGFRAVALNGTHVNDEAVEEIDRNADNVIWALDRDAFSKAQAYAKKYRMYFGQSVALLLPRDFKDMEWEEAHTCLSEIYLGLCCGVARPTTE